MASGDLLKWRNFEFWSTNICYCLLSAPQNQFKTEKKRVWLVNVFCWTNKRFIFSVKKRKQICVLQNSKFCQISKSPDDIHTTLAHLSHLGYHLNILSAVQNCDIRDIIFGRKWVISKQRHTTISVITLILSQIVTKNFQNVKHYKTGRQWVRDPRGSEMENWTINCQYTQGLQCQVSTRGLIKLMFIT